MSGPAAAPRTSTALPRGNVILCADDFGISDGVSRGIEDLVHARRLSATGAIVTLPTWGGHAQRLAHLRTQAAVGLHVNLTLAAPLGPMPALAPLGKLPALGAIVRQALLGALDRREIAGEIARQIDAFTQSTGFAPDFVDGHQHVHSLPGIRDAFLDAMAERFPGRGPLVRDPADRFASIVRRRAAVVKSLVISTLAAGFGDRARSAGFATNHGFSGVSPFTPGASFDSEVAAFFAEPGRRHLVMCHPGHPDDALRRFDEVVERRAEELASLMRMPGLPEAIWHVERGAGIDYPEWPGG